MNEALYHLFERSVAVERRRGAHADALCELAFASQQAGHTLADIGSRLMECWNSDREARDWHLERLRDASANVQRALDAYETAMRASAEAAS